MISSREFMFMDVFLVPECSSILLAECDQKIFGQCAIGQTCEHVIDTLETIALLNKNIFTKFLPIYLDLKFSWSWTVGLSSK